jgi:hypothetical protein
VVLVLESNRRPSVLRAAGRTKEELKEGEEEPKPLGVLILDQVEEVEKDTEVSHLEDAVRLDMVVCLMSSCCSRHRRTLRHGTSNSDLELSHGWIPRRACRDRLKL